MHVCFQFKRHSNLDQLKVQLQENILNCVLIFHQPNFDISSMWNLFIIYISIHILFIYRHWYVYVCMCIMIPMHK